MNEPEHSTVQPYPETLMLFDRADDAQIANRLRGTVLKQYVYAFKQQGQMIYGLGVDGAEACKRELASLRGEVIREDEIAIMYQDSERAYFQAKASRWLVKSGAHSADCIEVKLDTTIDVKNQAKFITRRDGTQEANPFWLEQGSSKAMRNAILNLIPEFVKQKVIAAYKAEAKVVEMTPDTSEAMGHEAHSAFNAKDEHDELVAKLHTRWRDELQLSKMAVEKILGKRGLPASLAHHKADWSTVDIAIVRDMLEDAGA